MTDLITDLRHDLENQDAYPPPKPQHIEVIETHISWVFRTEHDVYKIKKPVNLGFLDFRECQARKTACDDEVRLNRRLSQNVYHGVVPVRRSADNRYTFLGTGEIVDWAVHMRRLEDDQRTDQLLQKHALHHSHIKHIAELLVTFHKGCRSDAETAMQGKPTNICKLVEENFEQTAPSLNEYLSKEEARELLKWQRQFLDKNSTLMESRVHAGKVREGHGDLRLEHIYISDNAIDILDCVEFSLQYRCSDVCADIAFLTMDLAWHGRIDLAEYLLAVYAQRAGDYDLYALVDFYESYRAFVRGKIATFVSSDSSIDSDTRRTAENRARSYFLLALAMHRHPVEKPRVIALGGNIASGKSTTAQWLCERLACPVVDTDRTRKQLLGAEPHDALGASPWQNAYSQEVSEKVYNEVFRRADVVLTSERSVIIEASFHRADMRHAVKALAEKHGAAFCFIECTAPDNIRKGRLETRAAGEHVSDARIELFDIFQAAYERVHEFSNNEHFVLDTSTPEVSRARLCQWLGLSPV